MNGETILHYKILEKLGEGGMGVVYLAEDTKLERKVAIKFLPPHISNDSEERERFKIEAKAAASLNHPNIATIHAIEESGDDTFIVMEFIDGIELKDKIKTGPISIKEATNIAIQIAEGLEVAHKKEIVHRDIKSRNIMITNDGKVKIMDFGLAKIKGGLKLTKIGTTVGTIDYMSPEQARGEEIDYRTDIWSFGVVLYEMFTGQFPFKSDYDQATIYSILNEEPVRLSHFNDKVTGELERIVLKALEKDKEERYQHIDEILADLRKGRKNLEYAKAGYVKKTTVSTLISQSIKDNETVQVKTKKKKYPLKIIIPAAIIILIATLFFILNPFKSNEIQITAISSAGNSLAVMYFQNIPDPADKDHTGDMLTSLLITSLSQIKGLDVISRERLLEIEKDMGQTYIKEVPPSLAIKIAKEARVKTILTGSILQMQPKLAVTANLISVQTGRVIGSQQLTNFTESQIFILVDSLSYLLRGNLEAGTTSPSETKPVADVTTSSPEAYRAYVEGLNLEAKLYHEEASAAFERAVTLDSNFAMAYAQLYHNQNILGETEASLRSLSKAVELSDKTTEKERLEILALNYWIQNNIKKVIEVDNKRIRLYPHEINPYVHLGWTYNRLLLDPQKGSDISRLGVKINPNAKNLWKSIIIYSGI